MEPQVQLNGVWAIIIIVLLLFMFGAQMAFFWWVFRKLKLKSEPLSPGAYRLIAVIIAAVFMMIGIGSGIYTALLLSWGTYSTGTVVEMRIKLDKDDHSETFAPTFEFIDEAGAAHTIASSFASNPPDYHVGDRVSVVHWATNPGSARINGFAENWFVPIFTSALACVIFATIPIYRKWREFRDAGG